MRKATRYINPSILLGARLISQQALHLLDAVTGPNATDHAMTLLTSVVDVNAPGSKSRVSLPRTSDAPEMPATSLLRGNPTTSIFERPRPSVVGVRRVPKFVLASGFPMLRVNKPQSQVLSGMLRRRQRVSQARRDAVAVLDGWWIPISTDEDHWDAILRRDHNVGAEGDASADSAYRSKWGYDMTEARNFIEAKIEAERQKRLDTARKLQQIVSGERLLAKQEAGAWKVHSDKDRHFRS